MQALNFCMAKLTPDAFINLGTITKTEKTINMLICILDGNNITDKETLHNTLASSLQLPDWYGRNLDALYDCLSDIQEETEIRLLHEEALEKHLKHYAKALRKVVCRACQENPRIHFIEKSWAL